MMDHEVITIDDDDDDIIVEDDIIMEEEANQQQGSVSSAENKCHEIPKKEGVESSKAFNFESISFDDFEPITLDYLDEESEDDEVYYDPLEEVDIDDIEKFADERKYKPIRLNRIVEKPLVFSYTKNENVNKLLNSMSKKLDVRKLMDLLPDDFVKQMGGKHAAFKEVSNYVKDEKQKRNGQTLFAILIDLAKQAGATEEDIQALDKFKPDGTTEITPEKYKKEWDIAVAEAERNGALENVVEGKGEDIDEVRGDDKDDDEVSIISWTQAEPPTEEPISKKDEPELIILDED